MVNAVPAMPDRPGGWLPPPPWEVLRAPCFTPSQGRVLLALWSRCDSEGNCWPGLPVIAKDCGCDERTAKGAVEMLAAHGVITITKTTGQPNRYHLDPAHILAFVQAHDTPLKNAGGTKMTPPKIEGTTPRKTVGSTPLNFVETPPTKMRGEVYPVEEDPKEDPKKKTQSSARSKPEPDPRVRETMLLLEALQGPFAHYAAAAAEVKRMLARASPDEIVACWKAVKSDRFWRGKPLSMSKLNEFLTEYQAGRLTQQEATRNDHDRPSASHQPADTRKQGTAAAVSPFAAYG